MADAGMAWAGAGFPDRCLVRILRHLPCILDNVMFSGVCRRWRSIARENPPPKLPWLFMPSTAATSFFCVAGETTHLSPRLPDDARGARVCGSFPGGWLAVVLPESRGPALLNLCTGARVDLPRLLRYNGMDGARSEAFPIPILSIVLSESPSVDRRYYAAAIVACHPSIAFWSPGMDFWAPPMLRWGDSIEEWSGLVPGDPIEDIAYYFGPLTEGFYVLTAKEDVLLYAPETVDLRHDVVIMFIVGYNFGDHQVTRPLPGQVVARYLVQSRGDLLMVVRFVSVEEGTVEFQVFKLEHGEVVSGRSSSGLLVHVQLASWTDLAPSALSGRRIFLGRNCSIAVDTTSNPDSPLYIYFLDDAVRTAIPFPCADTGRSLLSDSDQDIVRCFPPGPPSDCSPWSWFFLSDETFRLVPPESQRRLARKRKRTINPW